MDHDIPTQGTTMPFPAYSPRKHGKSMALSSLLCRSWTLDPVRPPVSPDPVFCVEANVARGALKCLTLCTDGSTGPCDRQQLTKHLTFAMFPQHSRPPAWVQPSPGTRQRGCYIPSPTPGVKNGESRSMSLWRGW